MTDNRLVLVVALVVGVGLVVGAAPLVSAQEVSGEETDDGGREEPELSLGHKMSGVIAVSMTDVEGELERMEFEQDVAEADNESEQAGVVGDEVRESQDELAEIKEERSKVLEEFKAGELSQSEFAVRMAVLEAEQENVVEQVDRAGGEADELPVEALESEGVDMSRVVELRENASEMSGPEVSALATSLGGADQSEERGPPEWVEEKKSQDDGGDEAAGENGDAGENGSAGDEPETETEAGEDGRDRAGR